MRVNLVKKIQRSYLVHIKYVRIEVCNFDQVYLYYCCRKKIVKERKGGCIVL